MKNLHTEIVINAPANKVWNILTSFEKYPEWNPFIISIKGGTELGAELKVVLKNGKGTSVFKPTVVASDAGRIFEWLGSLPIPGLFKGRHHFMIEELNEGKVKFVHGEQFSGLLAGFIMKQIGEQTKNSFIAMNEALKKRAES